jgi:hypothetical protein
LGCNCGRQRCFRIQGFASPTPITANYDFSNAIENLSFTINHVNDDGGTTYDDLWTISAFDENGVQISGADIVAGLTGVQDESVTINADGISNRRSYRHNNQRHHP